MQNVHRVCSTILRRLRVGKKDAIPVQTHPSNIVVEESRTFCVSSLVKKGANSRHVFAAESLRMSWAARAWYFPHIFFFLFALSTASFASDEKRALFRGFVTRRAAERLQAFEECIRTVRQSCRGEKGKGKSKGWKRSGAVRRGYRTDIAASMASDASGVSLFDRDILKFYTCTCIHMHTRKHHMASYNTVRPSIPRFTRAVKSTVLKYKRKWLDFRNGSQIYSRGYFDIFITEEDFFFVSLIFINVSANICIIEVKYWNKVREIYLWKDLSKRLESCTSWEFLQVIIICKRNIKIWKKWVKRRWDKRSAWVATECGR